jgi:O-acetyl-ADP-ribose deacetylase (regulator of RNase III)
MWAMLLAVRQHNATAERKIEIIACPGLGTGYGHVPYKEAARQMAHAYRNYLNPPKWIDWNFATERQVQVRFGGDDGCIFAPEGE